MTAPNSEPMDSYSSLLAQVADYLSRPQQFVAVAEVQATLCHTLDLAREASVVLTSNGEPAAAIVPFATLEALRGALLHLLAEQMETSFTRMQAQVAREPRGEPSSEEELESLVADTLRRERCSPSTSASRPT